MRSLLSIFLSLFFVSSAHAHWSSQPSGAAWLRAVSGNNEKLYAVGSHGAILTSKDGITWSTQPSDTKNDLNAILPLDDQRAIAVGDFGAFVFTEDGGASWSTQNNDLYQNLNAIWRSKDLVYIVGSDGLILRSKDVGKTWEKLNSGTKADLFGIWGSSPQNIYVVGAGAVLQSSDAGKTWSPQSIGGYDKLISIWGPNVKELYIAQENGRLYSTKDAGKTWTWEHTKQESLFAIIGGPSGAPLLLGDEGILRYQAQRKQWELWKPGLFYGGLRRSDGALFFVGTGDILTFGPSTSPWSQQDISPVWLRSIWGSKQLGVFVSAVNGDLFHSKDDQQWSKISEKGTPSMVSLWGQETDDLLGVSIDGLLYRSSEQGKTWSKQDLPAKGFRCIWGAGGNKEKIYLAGKSLFTSIDQGKTWQEQTLPKPKESYVSLTPSTPEITGIWGANADDVYLISDDGRIFHTSDGGENWQQQESKTSTHLRAIWGSSKDDVYIVGDDGTTLHTTNQGKTWSTIEAVSPFLREDNNKEDFLSVWGSSANDVYIVGSINGRGLMLHSTDKGKTWSAQTPPVALISVWGLSAQEVYTINAGGELSQKKRGQSLAGSFAWETREYLREKEINALWQSPKGLVYAVGSHGGIQTTKDNGKTWEQQSSGVRVPLSGVFGISDDEIYVSGYSGLLLSTKDGGKTWEQRSSGTKENLYALWGESKGGLYAVGSNGVLLRSKDKGRSWSVQKIGAKKTLYSIFGVSHAGSIGTTLYTTGAEGTLLKSTNGGTTWSALKSGTTKSIFGIWGNEQDVFLVGDEALLHTTDRGKTWNHLPAAQKGMRAIWGVSRAGSVGEHVYVVGGAGEILHSKDNGKTWARETSGTKDVLSSVIGLIDGGVLIAGRSLYWQDGGKNWVVEAVSKQALHDLWGDAFGMVYAVGSNGTLWHSKEGKRAEEQLETKAQLLSIFGTVVGGSSTSVFIDPAARAPLAQALERGSPSSPASGVTSSYKSRGVILTNKSGWTLQSEVDWMSNALWVNSAGTIFAVGESFTTSFVSADGLVQEDDKDERKGALFTSMNGGKDWKVLELDFLPTSIFGTSKGVWLVGEKGKILYNRHPSSPWETQKSGVTTTLTSLWGDGAGLHVVGEGGVILYTEDAGKNWMRQRSNTNASLTSIWGDDGGAYAIGELGTLLSTKDKGKTWEKQAYPYNHNGTAIWMGNGEVYSIGQAGTKDGFVMRLQ